MKPKTKIKKVENQLMKRLSMIVVKRFMTMQLYQTEVKKITTTLTASMILMRLWLWISIQRVKLDVFKNLFLIKKV